MTKMSVTERLLAAEKASLKRERKTKEIFSPSLSELLGEDAYITIAAIDDDLYFDTAERIADEEDPYSNREMAVDVCVECIIDPDFHDEKIYSRFAGSVTPDDAVRAAFSAHELMEIATKAVELAGNNVDREKVEKVKN